VLKSRDNRDDTWNLFASREAWYVTLSEMMKICSYEMLVGGRDVGLETWSWSRDRSRPLFEVLVLALVSTLLVLVLVSASLVLVSVSEGGLEQDLRLCATATLLVSKVETSK